MKIFGTPLNSKLPEFDIAEYSFLNKENDQILKEKSFLESHYYWTRFLYWDFSEERPKVSLVGIF